MDQAIPSGPQAFSEPADAILHQARVDALTALHEPMKSPLAGAKANPNGSLRKDPGPTGPGTANPQATAPSSTALSTGDDRTSPGDDYDTVMQVAPEAKAAPTPAPTLKEPDSFGKVLGEHLSTDASAVGNGLMRGFTKLGQLMTMGAAGAASLVDKGISATTGKEHTAAADSVFDFMHKYVDNAMQEWQGPDTDGNPMAGVLGGAAEFVPQMLAGDAMPVTAGVTYGIDKAKEEIDQGHSVKTAAILGTTAAITNALFTKVPMKDPKIAMRIAKAIGWGEAINRGGEAVTKLTAELLKDPDFQKATKDIDPANITNWTVDALLQAAFAVFHGKGKIAGPKPPPDATAPPPGAEPPKPVPPAGEGNPAPPDAAGTPPPPGPPPAPEAPAAPPQVAATPTPEVAATPPPAQPAAVPDVPTAEPPKDLIAQFADAADRNTPRQGVFLSKDNLVQLGAAKDPDSTQVKAIVKKAQASGRLVKTDNGILVMPTTESAAKAKAELASGSDPQAVIGRITGAGDGKAPDQTAVVQGQTPEGAVATESMVRPDEVPAKVEAVKAEGRQPVVTTPEAAVARRRLGLALVGKQRLPVVIEEGAGEGKVRVRPLDEEGEPSKLTHDVPADMVSESGKEAPAPRAEQAPTESKASPAKEAEVSPAKEKPAQSAASEIAAGTSVKSEAPGGEAPPAATAEPVHPLDQALAEHEKQEVPAPGRKLVKLSDRQDNASSFAGALLKAAKDAEGKAEPGAIERAVKAAKEGLKLAGKTKEATDKGQGTGHARVTAIVDEMHRAARVLMGKAKLGDEALAVAPKAAALKERVTKKKEEVATGRKNLRGGNGITLKELRDAKFAAEQAESIASHTGRDVHAKEAKQARQKFEDMRARAEAAPEKKSAYHQALAEAKAKYPDKTEAELREAPTTYGAGRFIKKRQAEIEAEQKALAEKIKKESEEAFGTNKVIQEAEQAVSYKVSDGDILKARRKVQVAEDQHESIPSADNAKRLAAAKDALEKLEEQHAQERGIQRAKEAEATEQPKTTEGGKLKEKQAAKEHAKLVDDYVKASDEDAPEIFEKVVASAEKLADRKFTPQEIAQAKRAMESQRKMHAEESHAEDDGHEEVEDDFDPSIIGKSNDSALHTMWSSFHKVLEGNGFYEHLRNAQAKGHTISGHQVLNAMIAAAKDHPLLQSMLQKLRDTAPDVVVRPQRAVGNPLTGERDSNWAGLHTPALRLLQIQIKEARQTNAFTAQSLVHEFTHAATSHFIAMNPDHPLVKQLDVLRREMIQRMLDHSKEDAADVQANLAHFAGGQRPVNFRRELYGLHNLKEFAAELMSNPDFQRLVLESESWGKPTQTRNPFHMPTLWSKAVATIGKMLGFNADETSLLHRSLHVTGAIMDSQARNADRYGLNAGAAAFNRQLPSAVKEFIHSDAALAGMTDAEIESLPTLGQEPPKLPRGSDASIRDAIGEKPTEKIRETASHLRSGAVGAFRALKAPLTAMDQLLRRNMAAFGHPDDPKNPLRRVEESTDGRNGIQGKHTERAAPTVEARRKLDKDVSTRLGAIQIDATRYGIDPTGGNDHAFGAETQRNFAGRLKDLREQFNALPDTAKQVYRDELAHNKWAFKEERKASVNLALRSYDLRDITPAQRSLLYGVRAPEEYDSLIGPGKLIDVGDSNESLTRTLKGVAGMTQMSGPYFHLGRHGDYVVHIGDNNNEGSREFSSQAEASTFANAARDMSPGSRAKISQRGGKWIVDYKAEHTSFHKDAGTAEAAAQSLRDQGFDVGKVTKKTFGEDNTPITHGMKDLLAETTRKINSHGEDTGSKALVDTLRSTFLQMISARSAYAASKLSRKGAGGVKPEEMALNFARHASTTGWGVASMSTAFDQAEALGAVRAAARDAHAPVDQKTMYRRGEVVEELGKRLNQEARFYGQRTWGSAFMARLGFANFIASPAHAAIWMTQNFTTAMPYAGARYGYGRTTDAFSRAMLHVASPAFRAAVRGKFVTGNANDILHAVVKAAAEHPRFGKWAKGENSPLQQLIDKGAISHSFAQELGELTSPTGSFTSKVFNWSRVIPQMADTFNRVSTALAGLELTNGNVRATADLIRATHVDYSPENAPRAMRAIRKVPIVGSSVVMFKTYAQGMAHLLYSQISDAIMGNPHAEGGFVARRAEAAKTVAGMVLGTALFTGLKGATPELVHLGMYAYHKLFDDKDEFYSFDNSMHRALADMVGKEAGDVLYGGLPRLAGADVSYRMGLDQLIFHDPPDLFGGSKDAWKNFFYQELGVAPQWISGNVNGVYDKFSSGDVGGALNMLVPDKMYQDSMKAFEIYKGGATHEGAPMMMEPGNLGAAALQVFGFKPAELARSQERQGDAIDYRNFVKARRDKLIREFATKGVDEKKRDAFNKANPDRHDRITWQDIHKERVFLQRSSQQAMGQGSRNQDINRVTDY